MTKVKHTPFSRAAALSKQAALLSSIHNMLEWDQETYMPKNAIKIRSEQLEVMASLAHKMATSSAFKKSLEALIDLKTGNIKDKSLTEEEKSACREWRRDYEKAAKLPQSFVKEFAKTTSEAIHIWSEAKRHNSFKDFAPHLKKIVALCQKKAHLLGFEHHPYDALLDLYEPEMTSSYLDPLFDRLKPSLTHLLQKIRSRQPSQKELSHLDFPEQKQMHFGKFLLKSLGFTDDMSRLDISSHPFCNALCPSDVRMTTRLIPNNVLSSIFSVIHEAGHGIYEAQLCEERFGTPLGSSISLGLHESQSRLWETILGKSHPFWAYFYPFLQKEFPNQLSAISLDDFFLHINHISPSLIRTEADEVTYCLHVILRYELEKKLIEGSLSVDDLPVAWNEKMREYLGIAPSCDAEGCLQDIHWSMGGFGYFPTYALGNLYAAQLFECFSKANPSWESQMQQGQVTQIREWLKENIHKYGRMYTPHKIINKITGKDLSEKAYIDYLENKFGKLYKL